MANHGSTSLQKGKATSAAAAAVVKYIIVVIQIVIIVVIQRIIVEVNPFMSVQLLLYNWYV